jgi:hypothetical protein
MRQSTKSTYRRGRVRGRRDGDSVGGERRRVNGHRGGDGDTFLDKFETGSGGSEQAGTEEASKRAVVYANAPHSRECPR